MSDREFWCGFFPWAEHLADDELKAFAEDMDIYSWQPVDEHRLVLNAWWAYAEGR